jgi:hypothetical protein
MKVQLPIFGSAATLEERNTTGNVTKTAKTSVTLRDNMQERLKFEKVII